MKKLISMTLAAMLLCGLSTAAYSWDGHYRYRDGHYYRNAGWWGLGGFLTGLAVGSYVASLPPRYETVMIAGVPYYYADGYYYQAAPNGYIVASPPAGQADPGAPPGNNLMISVLEILAGILLLVCIGLSLKKLFMKERRPA